MQMKGLWAELLRLLLPMLLMLPTNRKTKMHEHSEYSKYMLLQQLCGQQIHETGRVPEQCCYEQT